MEIKSNPPTYTPPVDKKVLHHPAPATTSPKPAAPAAPTRPAVHKPHIPILKVPKIGRVENPYNEYDLREKFKVGGGGAVVKTPRPGKAAKLKDICFTVTSQNPLEAEHYYTSSSTPRPGEIRELLHTLFSPEEPPYRLLLPEVKFRPGARIYEQAEEPEYGLRICTPHIEPFQEHCTIYNPAELNGLNFDTEHDALSSAIRYNPEKNGSEPMTIPMVKNILDRLDIESSLMESFLIIEGLTNLFRVAANGGIFPGSNELLYKKGLAREPEERAQGQGRER